jgi:hypothetical protein
MKEDISTWQPTVKIFYIYCLRKESQVIPSLALAAGPRPTWRPGKLTWQPRLCMIYLALRGGAGDLKIEAQQKLPRAQPKRSKS